MLVQTLAGAVIVDPETLKLEIQRRRYKAKRNSGQAIDDALAVLFEDCPVCSGRGQVCTEEMQDGNPIAWLDTCPACRGDGFQRRADV